MLNLLPQLTHRERWLDYPLVFQYPVSVQTSETGPVIPRSPTSFTPLSFCATFQNRAVKSNREGVASYNCA